MPDDHTTTRIDRSYGCECLCLCGWHRKLVKVPQPMSNRDMYEVTVEADALMARHRTIEQEADHV